MKWIPKQLKNSRLLRSALALLCAFCLVGLPHESSAQNTNVKVGDATLEEFMAAFANAFENAHYVQVDTGNLTFWTGSQDLDTDIDTSRLPVLGFLPTPNGPVLFVPTIPTTPEGISYDNYFSSVWQYYTNMPPLLVSNVFDKINVFVDSVYQSEPSDPFSEPTRLSSLADALYDSSIEYLGDKDLYADGFTSLINTFGPRGSHFVIDASDASFANPPNGDVVQTFDWWSGNILSDMRNQLDGFSNQLATVIQQGSTSGSIAIDPNSWQDLIPALMDALKSLQYPADDENPWDDTSTSLTNSISQGVDSESNLTVRAFATATNGVPETVDAVTNEFGSLTSDMNDLLELFAFRNNHSSQPHSVLTIWTTGSMDMQTSAQGEAVSLGRMQIDFADPRFEYAGRPFWQYIRAACIVVLWAFYIIWFWHFFINWFHRFSNLLNS